MTDGSHGVLPYFSCGSQIWSRLILSLYSIHGRQINFRVSSTLDLHGTIVKFCFSISTTFDSYFGPQIFEAPKCFEFPKFSEFPNFFRAPKYLEFPKFLRPQNNSKPPNCLRSPGLVHYGRHDCLQISHRGIESITPGKLPRYQYSTVDS